MRKIIFLTSIAIGATFALHAQHLEDMYERKLNEGAYQEHKVEDPCRPVLDANAMFNTVFHFDKPVAAPWFQSPRFSDDLLFKVVAPPSGCSTLVGNIEFSVNNIPKLTIKGDDGSIFMNGDVFVNNKNFSVNSGDVSVKSGNISVNDGSVFINHTGGAWSFASYIKVVHGNAKAFVVEYNGSTTFSILGNGIVNSKKIYAEAIEVRPNAMNITWFDHVFAPDYKLMSLSELEQFIKTNRHLPDIPSEKEVKENGIDVFNMNGLLVKKVEELTLYIIDLEKRLSELEDKKGGE